MSQTTGSASDGQTESESPAADRERADREASGRRESTSDERNGEAVRSYSHRSSTAELGGLILAFAFGAVGFAARIFWIPALVVMAVVFGLLLADRRTSKSSKGVVPEIIASVVNEAREIYQAASGTSGEVAESEVEEQSDEARNRTSSEDDAPTDRGGTLSATTSETFNPATSECTGANGHSSIHRVDSSDADLPLTGESSKTHDKSHDDADEVDTESAGEPSVETGRVESHESESIEPEHTDSDSSGSDQPPAPTNELTETTVRPLPVRFILSADQMVARNPLLRPVRKRVLGVATSLSKTFVQPSAAPPDDSDH
jgi:hypothetical protein